MATNLPTGREFVEVFQTMNPNRYTKEGVAEMVELERKGRMVRDAQSDPVGVVRGTLWCTVPADSGKLLLPPIWFEEYKFTDEPQCFFGSKWVCPEDRPARNWQNAKQEFDANLDMMVPAVAEHYLYHLDSRNLIDGAMIVIYALDAVPDDFHIQLDYMYIGTALRY